MKNRILACVLIFAFAFSFCGCAAKSFSDVKRNYEKADYEIQEYDEDLLEQMNSQLNAQYSADGKVERAMRASNGLLTVYVMEFDSKDTLEIMYNSIKKELEASETIDFNGKILVYGSKKAVSTAFK